MSQFSDIYIPLPEPFEKQGYGVLTGKCQPAVIFYMFQSHSQPVLLLCLLHAHIHYAVGLAAKCIYCNSHLLAKLWRSNKSNVDILKRSSVWCCKIQCCIFTHNYDRRRFKLCLVHLVRNCLYIAADYPLPWHGSLRNDRDRSILLRTDLDKSLHDLWQSVQPHQEHACPFLISDVVVVI